MLYMKKRTAIIGALVSLMPLGQTVLIGTGAAFMSTAIMLSVPEKAKAESVDFLYERGNRRQESGDYYGALSDFSRIIEINPRDAIAYYNRGNAKRKLKDYYGAIADYTKAIEINPRYYKAYTNRGIAKRGIGDDKGGCNDYKKAISLGDQSTRKWLATDGGAWCRNMTDEREQRDREQREKEQEQKRLKELREWKKQQELKEQEERKRKQRERENMLLF